MSANFDDTTTMSFVFDETTSPSQLDELGQTYTDTFNLNPTPSKASPIRGHTMKEYDEKLSQLKKENFNLKLRIYFLEERMSQINGLKDKEEAIKNNIELKVENESMRKELSEKQELLCQAAKALDLLEDKSKDAKLHFSNEKSALENKIQELEKELQDYASVMQQMKSSAMTQSTDSQFSSSCFEVEQLAAQVQDLQDQLRDEKEAVQRKEEDIKAARYQSETLKSTVDSQQEIIMKVESLVGEKQSDFLNKIQKLLDCEKQVADLQAEVCAYEELQIKYSKLKAETANIYAKYNTVKMGLQRSQEEVLNLKKQIQSDLNKKPSACPSCSEHISLLAASKLRIRQLQKKIEEVAKSNDENTNKESMEKVAGVVHEFMAKVQKLKTEIKLKDAEIQSLKKSSAAFELEDKEGDNAPNGEVVHDRECRLQSIIASLREKESQLVACEQRLQARDNHIVELESEISSLKKELQRSCEKHVESLAVGVSENPCNDSSHLVLLKDLGTKDKEIESLNLELRKRTFNLQELVNKELWDKNKQIERLELRLAAQGALFDHKELELKKVRHKLRELGVNITPPLQDGSEINTDNVTKLQEQLRLSIEEQKYLSKEVDNLKERLRNTPERDSESLRLQRLVVENKKLKDEEEHNRLWRREASKGLSVLRTRLEELAVFLDELLHQPALVVGLCADRQRLLRAAINGSLELSRTIANLSNNSVTESSLSLDCHSQLSESNDSRCIYFHEDAPNVSNDLEPGKEGCSGTHKVNVVEGEFEKSLENDGSCSELDVLTGLRIDEEVQCGSRNSCLPQTVETTSKGPLTCGTSEMKVRRRSRSYPVGTLQPKIRECLPNPQAGSQSDSEAWSEPDRSVSQARMGIHDESSRTLSSAASTVRRISVGGVSDHSSSSSNDLPTRQKVSVRKVSAKEYAIPDEGIKLTARTHCLEKLNKALESELQICLPNSLGGSLDSVKPSKTETNDERHRDDKETKYQDIICSDVRETPNEEQQQLLSSQTLHELEEKVQELSVQVLEIEVRREQAEQDVQRAVQEKEDLRRNLEGKLFIAEREVEQGRHEICVLQDAVKQLTNNKIELEKEMKEWKDKAQEFEKEIEKWKRMAYKCEVEVKEIQSQLSHKFKEKLVVFEQLKEVAEKSAKDWHTKFIAAESKCLEIDRRTKEKLRLMEEQIKLKEAEIERRSEELQEKLKREAEIRASRKLEKIVEERMREYDLESCAAYEKRLHDAEMNFLSQLQDLENKSAEATADSEKRTFELVERFKFKENSLKERLIEAERLAKGDVEIRHQLNETAVAASQAQLETARLANEKLQLEQQVRWLQGEAMRDRKQLQDQLTQKILALTDANADLQKHVKELERDVQSNQCIRRKGCSSQTSSCRSGSPEGKVLTEITNLRRHCSTDMSDYMSEEPEQEERVYRVSPFNGWCTELQQSPATVMLTTEGNKVSVVNGAGRVTSASPDLGIESDQGRFSSLEPNPLKKSTTAPALNTVDGLANALQPKRRHNLDYKGLEQENQELKQRLQHTRQTLEQTYAQLAAANQRKRLVEKAICKQLHKTHHILRRAKDNFESNSVATPLPEEALK